jgi:hypothetical protein
MTAIAVLATPRSLLPPDYGGGEQREALLINMAAAYEGVKGDSLRNFRHWHRAQASVVGAIREAMDGLDVEAPPWAETHLWSRIELPGAAVDHLAHQRLLRAMLTDATSTFWSQFAARYLRDGNTHLDISGGTGLGKSSIGIRIMHTVKPFAAEALLGRIGLDPQDKAEKLPHLVRGDAYQDDDEIEAAGTGALTAAKNDRNTAAMLRASGVSLLRISPDIEATGTTQGRLEVLKAAYPRVYHDDREVDETGFWGLVGSTLPSSFEFRCRRCRLPWAGDQCACGWEAWSLCLFWVGTIPVGLVGVTWMPAGHHAVYSPWKKSATQRTLRQQFTDPSLIVRLVAKACEEDAFVQYLTKAKAKPKLVDFMRALRFFPPQTMDGETRKDVAAFMHDFFYAWENLSHLITKRWGITPNPGMQAIAKKCYAE